MQLDAAALHPGFAGGAGQQAALVQLHQIGAEHFPLAGVGFHMQLLGEKLHLIHIHITVQLGVPLIGAAVGDDAVLKGTDALLLHHVAEPVQDGPQGHVRIGGGLAGPQRIGQFLVGDLPAVLQQQILHQRSGLAGLAQLGQHGFAVHRDLKSAQHGNFDKRHGLTLRSCYVLSRSCANYNKLHRPCP